MNWLDYALIAVVALSALTAAVKGFVYEVLMMAATIAGVALAVWKYEAWSRHLGAWGSEEDRRMAAFVLILGAVLLLAALVGRLLRSLLRHAGLGWPDRMLGAALGLVRGVLLAAVILMMWTAYPFNPTPLRHSSLAPRVQRVSGLLAACMPSPLRVRFERGRDGLRQWAP